MDNYIAYMKAELSAVIALMLLTGCRNGVDAEKTAEQFIPPVESQMSEENAALDVQTAGGIMRALDTIDRIGACAVAFDVSAEYNSDDGSVYYKVVSDDLKNVNDVAELMEKYLTADFISHRYSGLLESDPPMCIDIDGELYIKYAPKGGGFAFSDSEPQIEKISETEYLIIAERDNYGIKENMRINVVKDGRNFKINNLGI